MKSASKYSQSLRRPFLQSPDRGAEAIVGMDIETLRALIRSTLTPLGLYSPNAEELLCATCAQESLLGAYRRQVGGPALGIFQMEPEDFNDIWTTYLAYKPVLSAQIRALVPGLMVAPDLVNNDPLAIAMARVHYLRAPGALPAATDLQGLWAYYKAHYNTPEGAATQAQFVEHYQTLVKGPAS